MRAAVDHEREVVLVSNGPGELYTWLRPVLLELRRRAPTLRSSIALVPCQFASGQEAAIAEGFGADLVTTPGQYLRTVPAGRAPPGLGAASGVVLQMGGNIALGARLADALGHPLHRYGFTVAPHRRVERHYVPDGPAAERAGRGTPRDAIEVVGNLVADAVAVSSPVDAPGDPHLLVLPGSRDAFARHLIPLMLAVVDRLSARLPDARFVWPVSRMLTETTLREAIAGRHAETLGGIAGRREGNLVHTPSGAALEMVPEEDRYAHMRSADAAITIPGTNTLELGIAAVPSLVVLPLNRPELIPLEGFGHWLGMVPLAGRYLKRAAVRAWVQGLDQPVSLPNRIVRERLFREVTGRVDAGDLADRLAQWLHDPADLARVRARLRETMPPAGAAGRVAERLLERIGEAA